MEPTIRERNKADLEELAAALVQVYEADGYPVEGVADPKAWLDVAQPLGAWVAMLDGAVVGHVALAEPGPADEAAKILGETEGLTAADIAVVGRLFVAPTGRGYGLGGRLLDAALEKAHQAHRVCVLDVMAKDKAAIHTYQKRGWTEIGKFSHAFNANRTPALAFREPNNPAQ